MTVGMAPEQKIIAYACPKGSAGLIKGRVGCPEQETPAAKSTQALNLRRSLRPLVVFTLPLA
jgi:hypothetical protein